jgi:hypothetical protein
MISKSFSLQLNQMNIPDTSAVIRIVILFCDLWSHLQARESFEYYLCRIGTFHCYRALFHSPLSDPPIAIFFLDSVLSEMLLIFHSLDLSECCISTVLAVICSAYLTLLGTVQFDKVLFVYCFRLLMKIYFMKWYHKQGISLILNVPRLIDYHNLSNCPLMKTYSHTTYRSTSTVSKMPYTLILHHSKSVKVSWMNIPIVISIS